MTTTHQGTLMVRGKGTGFVSLPHLNNEDVIIERDNLNTALDGDVVEITLLKRIPGERQAGKVTAIIKRTHHSLIGTVKDRTQEGKVHYYLAPDNRRIHIRPLLPSATASDLGMKVMVTLNEWNNPHLDPTGAIIDILGKAGDHETEMQAIIRSGGFSHQFPPGVETEAKALHENQAAIFATALADQKRRDIRSLTTFTIDPIDAKDFDDALSVEYLANGNISVGIHIADVSHYVAPGTLLDKEAQERGTSVYLVDRVIPMLPEILSNDLCSLRPHEDRLAFSAIFELTPDATIVNHWYGQTIINSDRRFTYEEAQIILDQHQGEYYQELSSLMTLGRILRRRRYADGAIAFEQPEIKFELDEQRVPIRAYKKERTETMMMIEDFMLLANTEVAKHINHLAKERGRDHAFVYRIHDLPDPERVEELAIFIRALGYEFETNKGVVKAKDINRLLKEIAGTPEENLIKTATIRSMAKAVYTTRNIGHFGLAFSHYTHFTSPIRRYPDLLVHRLLRRHLDNSPIKSSELATYESIANKSSKREMEAVAAERDSIKFKQVEFMQRSIGQEFEGIITGVADWGIYVQEQATLSEGMIKLASIKSDYFEHVASKYHVRGQRTGKIYRLGDTINVRLVRADAEERQLDFELVA